MKDKRIMKKILFAILLVGVLMFAIPMMFQIYETGYTVEAASVRMSKSKLTLNKGEKYTLKLVGGKKVKWSTSNKRVATVSSKGKVTAKARGTVTITATSGKKKYKCKLKVETPSMSKTSIYLTKGQAYTLKLKNTSQKVKWSTSNKKVAIVTSKGKVTAKGKGTATITAKCGNKKYTCKVKVETPSISKTSIKVFKGSTYTLKMNGTSRSVTWSTSNRYVATVDSKGRVSGVENGTAIITATVGGKKYRCKVSVQGYEKNIVTSYKKISKRYILVMSTNNNNCRVDYIFSTVKFYKNGALIGSREISSSCVGSGRTAYNKVIVPYNSTTNEYMEYDSIKITVDRASIETNGFRTDMYSSVYTETSKSQDTIYGVIGTIKNKGYREIKSAEIGVIYYKNGGIVGYSTDFVTNLYAGNEKVIQFSKPTDDDYNSIDFDSYKVVINYAYTY